MLIIDYWWTEHTLTKCSYWLVWLALPLSPQLLILKTLDSFWVGFWYLITKNVLTPSLCSLCVVNVAKNLAMFFLLPNKDHRCKVKYERHRLTTLNIFPFMCNIFLNILTMPVDYLFFNFNVWILINLVCFLITGGSDNQSLMIL